VTGHRLRDGRPQVGRGRIPGQPAILREEEIPWGADAREDIGGDPAHSVVQEVDPAGVAEVPDQPFPGHTAVGGSESLTGVGPGSMKRVDHRPSVQLVDEVEPDPICPENATSQERSLPILPAVNRPPHRADPRMQWKG
jgi:hypothetical protein